MIIVHLGTCSECGESLRTAKPAITCSTRCRVRRVRRRRREAEQAAQAAAARRHAASEAAFAALLAHGAEIRAAISEGRDPDRQLLDALAVEMDAASDLLADLGGP